MPRGSIGAPSPSRPSPSERRSKPRSQAGAMGSQGPDLGGGAALGPLLDRGDMVPSPLLLAALGVLGRRIRVVSGSVAAAWPADRRWWRGQRISGGGAVPGPSSRLHSECWAGGSERAIYGGSRERINGGGGVASRSTVAARSPANPPNGARSVGPADQGEQIYGSSGERINGGDSVASGSDGGDRSRSRPVQSRSSPVRAFFFFLFSLIDLPRWAFQPLR